MKHRYVDQSAKEEDLFQEITYSHVAVCVMVAIMSLLSGFCKPSPLRVTVDEVNKLLAKEVPNGSSVSQVTEFLDARKITHSSYSENPERESEFRDTTLDGKKHLVRGYMNAIIRDVDPDTWRNFTRWDIRITFYFDESGKLVHHAIRGVGTSL